MTIGYLIDDNLDVSDGVQQAMILIAEGMRARGHDVHYICSSTSRTDLSGVHSIGRQLSAKFNGNSVRTPLPFQSKKVKNLLNKIDFDVLHVQMPYSPFLSGKVIKNADQKVAIFGTFHILPYNKMTIIGTKTLRLLNKKTNHKIKKSYAVSKPALEFMTSDYGIQGSVLPNPVDYAFFSNVKLKDVSSTKSIVYVGRFDERKGVLQLIKAFKNFKETDRENYQLIMCGKGRLFAEVKKYSEDNDLNVIFPGFVSEKQKAQYLKSAEIAIFPSVSGESFGIVLAEAMASGASITIGGDNPGYRSVLGQWPETLFDASLPEAISAKLKQIVSSQKLSSKIGKQQHQAAKRYDIEKILDILERDYDSLKLALNS
jgi:phosphatidylinositol alpha-mannosyltransferase